jgi:hypothetical protein
VPTIKSLTVNWVVFFVSAPIVVVGFEPAAPVTVTPPSPVTNAPPEGAVEATWLVPADGVELPPLAVWDPHPVSASTVAATIDAGAITQRLIFT